ncbi:hypothetical protein DKG74_19320 [Zavarzinia aquatilis]|uniref:HTH cro/C1-type domain-containing protein n=2 Tax=Zavarzinia aquatilis TaxID=2211142 RepID=A0A317DVK0_9PROT|nr:hypothetical protein DKG74_19320 [Zavarzinia aquatilis]
MLRWARERAGIRDAGDLTGRFPKISAWESGHARRPPQTQMEAFARAVHAPVGDLFLPAPRRCMVVGARRCGATRWRPNFPCLLALSACREARASAPQDAEIE